MEPGTHHQDFFCLVIRSLLLYIKIVGQRQFDPSALSLTEGALFDTENEDFALRCTVVRTMLFFSGHTESVCAV